MKKRHILASCLVFSLVLGSFCFVPLSPAASPTTQIKIGGGRVGDTWYVMSEALAHFINKGSDWLRATVVATPGITGNFELAIKSPKEYIMAAEMTNFVYMPKDPYGKAYNYYDKARFIATTSSLTCTWITYDKKIATGKDVARKNVSVGRKAAARTIEELRILEEWGVLDRVKLVQSGYGGAVSALRDGLVDVANMVIDHIYPTGFSKGAFITDAETRGPIYYITVEPDLIRRLRGKGGASIPVRVPAGFLDPKTQPSDLWVYAMPVFFAADERMDEKIVHEITRIIWESAGKWETWHVQGKHMTKEFIPAMPMDFKYIHPGAKKYYDEHGVKLRDLADLLS